MSEQTTPSKKISVGLILSWIFGVLFALTGIVSVFSEPIPGLVMLVMAAVLLPPVTKLVDQKWKFHLSGGMKAIVIIIGFIIFGSTVDTSKQQMNQPPVQQEQSVSNTEQKKDEIKPTEEQPKITTKTGNYEQYTYTIIEEEYRKEKVATFQPFLPRNDDVLIGAIRKVTSQTFGNNDIKTVAPTMEERNGINLILFNASSGRYYYSLVKEDTGEVHSFSFWKE